MSSFIVTILVGVFLASLFCTSVEALSDGFAVEVGPSGVELVWSSNITGPVRMGSSRPEFRLPSGVVFGYPREIQGKLVLPMSIKDQDLLATKDGQKMEVWLSGRRLDITAPANIFTPTGEATKATVAANANTPTVSVDPAAKGSYNTTRLSYNLPTLQLNSSEFPFPLEVVGEVTVPTRMQATIRYPLILFCTVDTVLANKVGPKESIVAIGLAQMDGYPSQVTRDTVMLLTF